MLVPRLGWAEETAPANPEAAEKQVVLAPIGVDATVAGVLAAPFEGARSLGDWGYGVLLSLGAHWKSLPLSAGIDILPVRWGSATSPVDIRLGDSTAQATLTRRDQTVMLGSWLRFQPTPLWRVKPFVEGFAGVKLLSTEYSLAFVNGTGNTSSITEKDSASNFGLGAGVDVLIAKASDDSGSAVFASLAVRQLWGSNASFTRARDPNSPNQLVSFDVPTQTTIISLGFSLHAQRKVEPRPAAL